MSSFYAAGTGEVGGVLELLPEEARHAAQVLRLRPGERVDIVDGVHHRFSGVIESIDKNACTVRIEEQISDNESPIRVTLYQGLPKAEKMELVVQKLTELGTVRIVPVKMERCVVKLNDKDGEKRRERLEKIAKEASKQCRRSVAPEIIAPATWKQLEADMSRQELLLVPWEDADGYSLKTAYSEHKDAKDIGIVIGPEGGMSADEVEALRKLGAHAVTLGPRILRTETAAIASCAMVMTLWGDIG